VLLPVHRTETSVLLQALAGLALSTEQDLIVHLGLDGPADPSQLEAVSKLAARCGLQLQIHQFPRQGLVVTLNKLIDLSDSEYLARQDGDDMSLPTRLQEQRESLEAQPEMSFCGTQMSRCSAELVPLRHQRRYPSHFLSQLAYASCLNNPIAHPTLMLRRAHLGDHRYRDVPGAEDWQLYVDLWGDGRRSFNTRSTGLLYRTHPGQITAQARDGSTIYRLQQASLQASRLHGLAPQWLAVHWLSQSLKLTEGTLALRRFWQSGRSS
jgi:hypothetical protein